MLKNVLFSVTISNSSMLREFLESCSFVYAFTMMNCFPYCLSQEPKQRSIAHIVQEIASSEKTFVGVLRFLNEVR